METIRLQIESRYSLTLNFAELAPRVLTPFGRASSGVSIQENDPSRHEVSYEVQFAEERYMVLVRMDRLVFSIEKPDDDALSETGPLGTFFRMQRQLRDADALGPPIGVAVGEVSFATSSEDRISTVTAFRERYLAPGLPWDNAADVVLMLQREDDGITERVQLGPYQGASDREALGMSSRLVPGAFLVSDDAAGYFLSATVQTQTLGETDFGVFRRLHRRLREARQVFMSVLPKTHD